mgnify:CR=1 FL=1
MRVAGVICELFPKSENTDRLPLLFRSIISTPPRRATLAIFWGKVAARNIFEFLGESSEMFSNVVRNSRLSNNAKHTARKTQKKISRKFDDISRDCDITRVILTLCTPARLDVILRSFYSNLKCLNLIFFFFQILCNT